MDSLANNLSADPMQLEERGQKRELSPSPRPISMKRQRTEQQSQVATLQHVCISHLQRNHLESIFYYLSNQDLSRFSLVSKKLHRLTDFTLRMRSLLLAMDKKFNAAELSCKFGNRLGFSSEAHHQIMESLKITKPISVTNGKIRVCLLSRESNFPSLLPELVKHADVCLIVNETPESIEGQKNGVLENDTLDDYLKWCSQHLNPDKLNIVDFSSQCISWFSKKIGMWDSVLENETNYLAVKKAIELIEIKPLKLDLRDYHEMQDFAKILSSHNAEITFLNLSDIHEDYSEAYKENNNLFKEEHEFIYASSLINTVKNLYTPTLYSQRFNNNEETQNTNLINLHTYIKKFGLGALNSEDINNSNYPLIYSVLIDQLKIRTRFPEVTAKIDEFEILKNINDRIIELVFGKFYDVNSNTYYKDLFQNRLEYIIKELELVFKSKESDFKKITCGKQLLNEKKYAAEKIEEFKITLKEFIQSSDKTFDSSTLFLININAFIEENFKTFINFNIILKEIEKTKEILLQQTDNLFAETILEDLARAQEAINDKIKMKRILNYDLLFPKLDFEKDIEMTDETIETNILDIEKKIQSIFNLLKSSSTCCSEKNIGSEVLQEIQLLLSKKQNIEFIDFERMKKEIDEAIFFISKQEDKNHLLQINIGQLNRAKKIISEYLV